MVGRIWSGEDRVLLFCDIPRIEFEFGYAACMLGGKVCARNVITMCYDV